MMMKKITGILALCFISVGMVWATVTPVAPGDNTLSAAITAASAGDTLELAAGVFWETNTINTLNGDLTIIGAESDAHVIIFGPTAPDSATDLIRVYGNLWLNNLVFVGSDSCVNGIANYYGSVTTEGDELTAVKNNINVTNCMFLMIGLGVDYADNDDVGDVFWSDDDSESYADGAFHPVDTLRFVDCYVFGGFDDDSAHFVNDTSRTGGRWVPGWQAKATANGIRVKERQAHYVEVRYSSFWYLIEDPVVIDGGYIGSASTPEAGSDVDYISTICDHNTVYKTWRGDGYQYEYSNETQSMTNCIASITGRFSYKAKRGNSTAVVASYCMGDSSNNSDDFTPKTIFYSTMTQGDGCWPFVNPYFNDPENGDFSLDPAMSDAIGTANDGVSNLGDPHWDNASTFWPSKAEIEAIDSTARAGSGPPLAIEGSSGLVKEFALHQNYPNPFNPTTRITYSILEGAPVKLDIYDILGRKIRTLVNEVQNPNTYTLVWDGLDDHGSLVSGGVYFYRLQAGSSVETRKMVLLK